MSKATMRTHVVIPKELVDSIDELVGRRSRSKFLTEAAEEKLRRLRLARAAAKVVGSLAGRSTPGWESSEAAAKWVSDSRRADDERLKDLLGRR
jgi:Arc/MetJ-type ribon-helix-helix transcriptional regulator